MTTFKQNILPISNPIITSYPLIANMLSVLGLHQENTSPWLYDRFIQLIGRKTARSKFPLPGNFYDYEIGYNLPMFISCPFLKISRFEYFFIDKNGIDFSEFIIQCIDEGYYLHLCLDQFFISDSINYKKRHFNHPTFLYGYNKDSKEIFIKDFYEVGYKNYTIGFEEIDNAYKNVLNNDNLRDFQTIVSTIKYKDYEHKFNINKVIRDYNDYLTGEDGSRVYKNDAMYGEMGFSFGIKYYDVLDYKIKESIYDIRPFHVLFDHKVLQESRIKYMLNNNYLQNNTEILKYATELKENALLLRNLILKEKIVTSNDKSKLLQLCSNIKYNDTEFVQLLLKNIIRV